MENEEMTAVFEVERPRLLKMARRMLPSPGDAEDAVQNAWLRANRSDLREVVSLQAWLTTTLVRLCIDMLRTQAARREEPIEHVHEATESGELDEKLALAEAAQDAMAMVFETLGPDERVAFIMHDVFDLEFDEISRILMRSTEATRQLASRARRRLRAATVIIGDLTAHRQITEDYLAATKAGDLDKVLSLLHQEVKLVVRNREVRVLAQGADSVARNALQYRGRVAYQARADAARLVLVDGRLALATFNQNGVDGLLIPDVREGLITHIELIFDITIMSRMDIAVLN